MEEKMQREITDTGALLDSKGQLVEKGYARHPLRRYRRSDVKASSLRIKEWDYYCTIDQEQGIGVAFTLADLGFLGLVAVHYLDFNTAQWAEASDMIIMPRGRMGLAETSGDHDVVFEGKNIQCHFRRQGTTRKLDVTVPRMKLPTGERGLSAALELFQPDDIESMVIATPWAENPRAFYYNEKINCMPAQGTLEAGTSRLTFNPEASMTVLDWGRGVWTYRNTWYWASLSARVEGHSVGLNLGYGFGDTSAATENMLFFDGEAHKLDQVTFHFNDTNLLHPWTISDNEGRLDLRFTPILDRNSATNFLVIKSIQHQVFGYYEGTIVRDDGTAVALPKRIGFAEKVINHW